MAAAEQYWKAYESKTSWRFFY